MSSFRLYFTTKAVLASFTVSFLMPPPFELVSSIQKMCMRPNRLGLRIKIRRRKPNNPPQHGKATGGVISNTPPLWNKDLHCLVVGMNWKIRTPGQFAHLGPQDCLRGRIFQYIPSLSSVLLHYRTN